MSNEEFETYVYENREDVSCKMIVLSIDGFLAGYGKKDIDEDGRRYLGWADAMGCYTGLLYGPAATLRNEWRRVMKQNPDWSHPKLPESPIPY